MKLRAMGLLLAALAMGGLASAQDKPLQPTNASDGKKITCSFCGAVYDAGDGACPFCGGKETTPPPPRTDAPAPPPAASGRTGDPSDMPRVAPTPQLTDPSARPAAPAPPKPAAPPTPVAPAPGPAVGTPAAPANPGMDEDGTDYKKLQAYRDDNMAKGDYYFKTGYYLKASEAYRVAVLAEPVNPWKKLAFGHALFAIGNYSYASYALRRAVQQLDVKVPFAPDVSSLFPSKRAFEKAVKDLKRYVTYSPRDPAGLSVLGYMLFAQGEDDRAREMFVYLQRLPKNDNDAFATFFLKQIDARKGESRTAPELTPPKPPTPAPAPQPVQPPAPPPSVATPEGARQGEEPAKVKPAPARALADE
jgi:hypothetical protein